MDQMWLVFYATSKKMENVAILLILLLKCLTKMNKQTKIITTTGESELFHSQWTSKMNVDIIRIRSEQRERRNKTKICRFKFWEDSNLKISKNCYTY